MAKKRRKPANRPRNPQAPRTTVRTAARPDDAAKPVSAQDRGRDARADGGPRARSNDRGPGPSTVQRSRADKKEMARRQREDVRRRVRRRQRMRTAAVVGAIVLGVGAGLYLATRPDAPPAATETLPGLLRTEAPWDANGDEAAARADAINLPAHGSNLAMHEHAVVQIFVRGVRQPVPVDIGIDAADGAVESIHTHSGDGVVHVESSTVDDFTLQQFFDVWGVRFTERCLGAYCDEGESGLQVFVNGEEYTEPLPTVPLDEQQVIVVTYGTPGELPDPVPSSFDFTTVNP